MTDRPLEAHRVLAVPPRIEPSDCVYDRMIRDKGARRAIPQHLNVEMMRASDPKCSPACSPIRQSDHLKSPALRDVAIFFPSEDEIASFFRASSSSEASMNSSPEPCHEPPSKSNTVLSVASTIRSGCVTVKTERDPRAQSESRRGKVSSLFGIFSPHSIR
jgi:hypothetical protein